MPGNLSGRTDGQTDRRTDGRTDGRTCRKTVTVGRVDQRTHVQVKRGYFRLRTDGRTDGRTTRKHNASGAYRRRHNKLEYKFPELSPKSGDIEAERMQGKGTLSITIYLLSFRRTWLFYYRQTAVKWDEITGHNTFPEVLLLPIA